MPNPTHLSLTQSKKKVGSNTDQDNAEGGDVEIKKDDDGGSYVEVRMDRA